MGQRASLSGGSESSQGRKAFQPTSHGALTPASSPSLLLLLFALASPSSGTALAYLILYPSPRAARPARQGALCAQIRVSCGSLKKRREESSGFRESGPQESEGWPRLVEQRSAEGRCWRHVVREEGGATGSLVTGQPRGKRECGPQRQRGGQGGRGQQSAQAGAVGTV